MLKQAQEHYDAVWDAWWTSRSPADKERLEAEADARLEAELEPVKDRRRRQWLIDHPDADERVFDQKIRRFGP